MRSRSIATFKKMQTLLNYENVKIGLRDFPVPVSKTLLDCIKALGDKKGNQISLEKAHKQFINEIERQRFSQQNRSCSLFKDLV